jgi:heme/copper-type cytochrome/quinol oxidase subunit 3
MSVAHGEQVRILEEHGQEGEHGLNWWGMMFFLSSEALIFANFIAAYLYLEIQNLPRMGGWRLDNVVTPLIFTVVLVSSSGTVHLAGMAMRKGNMRAYSAWLALTIVLGAIFLGGQATEYTNLVEEHFTLSSSIFGSSFFTLTGFHGGHVTIGVIFLIIVLIRALRGDFTKYNHFAATAVELYWHFVDIVWIFVFSLVYLVPFFLPGPK